MKLLLFLLIPASVFAQNLEQHIKAGDTVFVTDRSGHEVAGKLTFLSADSLRVFAKGIERDVPRRDVGRVEKPDAVWDGAALGAGIFGLAFAGGAGASCSPHCAGTVLFSGLAGAVLGGYVGALIDKAIPGRRVVYGVAPDSAFAISPTRPISTSSDLWMKLNNGDRIRVVQTGGLESVGKFTASSPSSLTLVDGGRREDIPAQNVARITRRSSYLGLGTLGGLSLGIATSAAGICQDGAGHPEYIGCPLTGALIGAIIGRLISRHDVVYESPDFAARQSTNTSPLEHSVFISGKLGGYGSYSDPTDGTALGGGVSADVFVTKRWAVDVDLWIPRRASGRLFLPSSMSTPVRNGTTITYGAVDAGEFRDTIAGVAAMRSFGGTGVHPYVLAGVAQAWTSARTPTETWTETSKGGLQAGAGLVIPAARNLDIMPEFRIIAGLGYFVARPTVGIRYRMH